ncbi:MerR family transcriptional regulator [Pseudomonas sp. CFBP 8770]|uniref:MerR family transcriptional regulator n=1 Tax=unclassified Pseudomonas TaxID=196821 RepID=UPI0017858D54|nr:MULTISPECIES: MerR family transcriptional regulator [unclassified Pseudomonas]MBD8474272.1 MerR family transcriptional regulator [Pseudomonas sp. CFBP 8773]MBD8647402.1 MerR family transcriptional regulator [Pseudomonas sp. CFBP 8770]
MSESGTRLPGLQDHALDELYPIREVARLTGINPVTLRAWERRYGLVQPTRTESGHRLYSLADIEEVRSILGWIERGVAVSKVGKILARTQQARTALPGPCNEHGEWQQWQERIRQCVREFAEVRLDQVYGQVFSSYPLAVVFEQVLMPVWQELLVHQGHFGQASEWLFLDTFLRARTLQRLRLASDQGQDNRVLLVAIPEQCRELELQVTGLLLGAPQVEVQLLGLGQPLEELSLVCEKLAPQAVVLFSNRPPLPALPRQLARLNNALNCPLLLAGELSEMMQEGLRSTEIACLGSDGRLMQRRLQQYLAGHLDS